jgi:hypothetical protein
VADWDWRVWASNAKKMHGALLEEGFTEPQALIIVGQMLGALVSAPK